MPRGTRQGRSHRGTRRHAMASVDFGGITQGGVPGVPAGRRDRRVRRSCTSGFAIQRLDEESASETLDEVRAARACSTRSSATAFELAAKQAGTQDPTESRRRRHEVPRRVQDPELAAQAARPDPRQTTRPWAIMEVCGGQTHSIIRHGIDQLLPDAIEMIHGPGCPVCVTPLEMIDKALEIAVAARRDLLLVRRHAARAGQRARTCSGSRAPAATCASSTRRWTR